MILAKSASIAAILTIPAETVLMAVILVVEDVVFIRDDAGMMSQDWGDDTLSASDVVGALSFLHSPRQIDILLTDIQLKKAVLAVTNLRARPSSSGAIWVCATRLAGTVNDKAKASFVEGARFVPKPYTQHELQHSVEILLATQF